MINICERERQIVKYIAEGLAVNLIAKKMNLSVRTVCFFIKKIQLGPQEVSI